MALDNRITATLAKAALELEDNAAGLQELLDITYAPDVVRFVERVLEWKSDYNRCQWLYTFLLHATPGATTESLGWMASFSSFVSNCCLDDSYFKIHWIEPDYLWEDDTLRLPDGTSFMYKRSEIQYIPRGEPDFYGLGSKYKVSTKDNPNSEPTVFWSNDDNDPEQSQDVKLLLEAMDLIEAREKQRIADIEDMQEKMAKISGRTKKHG